MILQLSDYNSESKARRLVYFDVYYKKNYGQVFAFDIVTRCTTTNGVGSLEIHK